MHSPPSSSLPSPMPPTSTVSQSAVEMPFSPLRVHSCGCVRVFVFALVFIFPKRKFPLTQWERVQLFVSFFWFWQMLSICCIYHSYVSLSLYDSEGVRLLSLCLVVCACVCFDVLVYLNTTKKCVNASINIKKKRRLKCHLRLFRYILSSMLRWRLAWVYFRLSSERSCLFA